MAATSESRYASPAQARTRASRAAPTATTRARQPRQSGARSSGAASGRSARAGTSVPERGPRLWRWWMRQPVAARRAFRGLLQTGLAGAGFAALLARPVPGLLGEIGGALHGLAGWGAYAFVALLLAWGVALFGTGITKRPPLSRLQLLGACAEVFALLATVRVFFGGEAGGWVAGILAQPLLALPPLGARALAVLVPLVLVMPLTRMGPVAFARSLASLTPDRASHASTTKQTDEDKATTVATPSPGAASHAAETATGNTSGPATRGRTPPPAGTILRYVESTPQQANPRTGPHTGPQTGPHTSPQPPTPRKLLPAPATLPRTTADDTPTLADSWGAQQGWPTAGTGDVTWQLPPLDLFDAPTKAAHVDQQALRGVAARLDAALRRVGIDAWVPREEAMLGPSLLTFVLHPPFHLGHDQAGRWLDRVLQRREALLTALGIPEAQVTLPPTPSATRATGQPLATGPRSVPHPPAASIWVQVPHAEARGVSLHEVITAPSSEHVHSPLLLPLGRTTTGDARSIDLAQCAHLLVGGAAETGKSTLLQSLLAGALAQATPRQVALALADPTQRTLGEFEGLPHLLAPVATTPAEVLALIESAQAEAERRERLLASLGATSLASYTALDAGKSAQPPLPQVLLVLDAVEAWDAGTQRAIAARMLRLAGIGRLTGISLVLAGRVPEAGHLLQALEGVHAARVAFATDSAADARLLLGIGGAESLTREGDLLYLPLHAGTVEHVHAACVTADEVRRLTRYWKRQAALAASEDATTIPGLYDPADDETVMLAASGPDHALEQRRGWQADARTAILDTPTSLPPLPGRQPFGVAARMQGDAPGDTAREAPGGLPFAAIAHMMRALVAHSDEDGTDTWGDGRGRGARGRTVEEE